MPKPQPRRDDKNVPWDNEDCPNRRHKSGVIYCCSISHRHVYPEALCLPAVQADQERLKELEAERDHSLDREFLGKLVRTAWIEWATEQSHPKPSWLVPWEKLPEKDKEADRRIGEYVASKCVIPELLRVESKVKDLEATVGEMRGACEKLPIDDLIQAGDRVSIQKTRDEMGGHMSPLDKTCALAAARLLMNSRQALGAIRATLAEYPETGDAR